MGDVTARFRDNANILRAATKDWDGSIQPFEAIPIEGMIRVGDLVGAADEIVRLRARVAALEADKAQLVAALEKCAFPNTWHAPCIKCGPKIVEHGNYIARTTLNDVKGGGDDG